MYTIIKSEAPDTVIVWSPNTGYSYPFGASLSSVASAADRRALDTNNDGQLTSADDPYSPFYPGDQYVDWNGYSMYYKGPDFANINQNQVRGYFYDVIHGISPYASQGNTVDWYQTYCAQKPTKACVISEAGAAYHTSPNLMRSQVNTQLQIQQTWWRDGPLNQTLLSTHPRLKMYIQFEFIKNETDGGVLDERDYRILNNSAVNAAFQSDLSSYATRYVTANMTTSAAPNSTAFHLTPSGPVVTATVTPAGGSAITATYTQVSALDETVLRQLLITRSCHVVLQRTIRKLLLRRYPRSSGQSYRYIDPYRCPDRPGCGRRYRCRWEWTKHGSESVRQQCSISWKQCSGHRHSVHHDCRCGLVWRIHTHLLGRVGISVCQSAFLNTIPCSSNPMDTFYSAYSDYSSAILSDFLFVSTQKVGQFHPY